MECVTVKQALLCSLSETGDLRKYALNLVTIRPSCPLSKHPSLERL